MQSQIHSYSPIRLVERVIDRCIQKLCALLILQEYLFFINLINKISSQEINTFLRPKLALTWLWLEKDGQGHHENLNTAPWQRWPESSRRRDHFWKSYARLGGALVRSGSLSKSTSVSTITDRNKRSRDERQQLQRLPGRKMSARKTTEGTTYAQPTICRDDSSADRQSQCVG